jgi:hypothetical protein
MSAWCISRHPFAALSGKVPPEFSDAVRLLVGPNRRLTTSLPVAPLAVQALPGERPPNRVTSRRLFARVV